MGSKISRRNFVTGAAAGAVSVLGLEKALAAAPQVAIKGAAGKADPKSPNAERAVFSELPISAIDPQGWLRAMLTKQKDGLTGHLDDSGGHPFNTLGWAGPPSRTPPDWWSYEQTGYWADGMTRCGHLLSDEKLIEKAHRQTLYVLDHPDSDGYLGPDSLKKTSRWPHAVFFRALAAEYSASGDPRIVAALKRHYLSSPYQYDSGRDVCNIETIVWTYQRDGDPRLLKLAQDTYAAFEAAPPKWGFSAAILTDGKPTNAHGVSYNEIAKLGAILYMETGDPRLLEVSREAYRKLDKFHMLPDGVNTSTELIRAVNPLESHETCDISDYSWSVGYLLMATGEVEYADKIERACFNAAPGAVTEDFSALQYFSCPNQVISAHNTNHNLYYRGDRTMAYATNHIAQCCSGNVNRAMPNYVARMWMQDGKGGLVAALYGPSKVSWKVGKENRQVTITEETRYPFRNHVRFAMQMDGDVEFPFTVRIPGWSSGAKVMVNDQPVKEVAAAGKYVTLHRKFRDGDVVTVTLPQQVRISHWPMDGVVVERGPLVYSLRIAERWQTAEETEQAVRDVLGVYWTDFRFPGLLGRNAYPDSPWNYALAVEENDDINKIEVKELDWSDDAPWSLAAPPIALKVPARRVNGWKLVEATEIEQQGEWFHPQQIFKRQGRFTFTPQIPDGKGSDISLAQETEMVTLIPYGCAKLRLTIFPRVSKLA